MIGTALGSGTEFLARLLAGGVFELVVLVILCVLALIVVVALAWLAWKLLLALGKGVVWGAARAGEGARALAGRRREEKLASLAPVAAGWDTTRRKSLRRTLAEAERRTGANGVRIVLVSGAGETARLCADLDLHAPGPAAFGVAAGEGVTLIDASQATDAQLRTLAHTLAWARPLDGIGIATEAGEMQGEELGRAAVLAHACALEAGVHLVVRDPARSGLWTRIEQGRSDGRNACETLARDGARWWLRGGEGTGLDRLAGAAGERLAGEIDQAIAAAPTPQVQIASVALGGRGLLEAVGRSTSATRPARAGVGRVRGFEIACAVFLGLGAVTAIQVTERSRELARATETVMREARSTWVLDDTDAVPNPARVYRIAHAAHRLSASAKTAITAPLMRIAPHASGPDALGAALTETYVLRPLGVTLTRRTARDLAPSPNAREWLDRAERVGEWSAAWEGLREAPEEVDLARLLADAFGDAANEWPEQTERMLPWESIEVPPPESGGLDTDAAAALARAGFVETMRLWADAVYTHGPIATATAQAADEANPWPVRYAALSALRQGLGDPDQRWITAAKDDPSYRDEAWVYGRSLAMGLLGASATIQGKAAVSAVRRAARHDAPTHSVHGVGPLLVRSSAGSAGGASATLALSRAASAWLEALEQFHGLDLRPAMRGHPASTRGPVTIEVARALRTRERVETFERLATRTPQGLAPGVFSRLVEEVGRDVERASADEVEAALRPFVHDSLGERERASVPELEEGIEALGVIARWLAKRAASPEQARVLDARRRLALTMLEIGQETLDRADPLAVRFDAGADRGAMVRRFERGAKTLEQIYTRHAHSDVTLAAAHGHRLAAQWAAIGEDLAGYRAGDALSGLSAMSGMIRAYADDPDSACAQPASTHAEWREDYIAEALRRYAGERARACNAWRLAGAKAAYDALAAYYESHVAGLWPYAASAQAGDIGAGGLARFIERVRDAAPALAAVEGRLSGTFEATRAFWGEPGEDTASIAFVVRWRTRGGEERNAEHVAEAVIEGTERDASGLHTWRYGTPLALRLRLARHSPLRFADGALEHTTRYEGNAALLRALAEVSATGAWSAERTLVDAEGAEHPLRLSAQLERPDGAPLALPEFVPARAGGPTRVTLRAGSAPAPDTLSDPPPPGGG